MAFNVEEVCDQLQEALRVFVRHCQTEMDPCCLPRRERRLNH